MPVKKNDTRGRKDSVVCLGIAADFLQAWYAPVSVINKLSFVQLLLDSTILAHEPRT